MQIECPCCGGRDFRLAVPRAVLAWETRLREAFARARADGVRGEEDLADRTTFTHGEAVDLYGCTACGLLVRDDLGEDFTAKYAREAYAREVLEHFHERDVRFFAQKRSVYVPLLPARARVVEVGSYAGGFLHVAAAWGWDATGVDVGEDVVRFAVEKGYRALRGTLEACAFAAASVDGVFIWNCFEQLQAPHATLAEAHRILRPGGLLVLRIPNAGFYRVCRAVLDRMNGADVGTLVERPVTKMMGYNNLLGFPYAHGYAPEHLRRLVQRHAFVPERYVPSHLSALPAAEAPAWALAEEGALRAQADALGEALSALRPEEVVSPWLEFLARRP